MAKAAMNIGGLTFSTKKAVLEHCREILYSTPIGAEVSEEHFAFLSDLVSRHPSAVEKIGVGIDHFTVRLSEWRNCQFWLHRSNGTATDFSFLHCVSPKSELQDFKQAARHTVTDQIKAFKEAAFAGRASFLCPLTGEGLTLRDSHADHIPPDTFDALIYRFIQLREIDIKTVEITGFGDGEQVKGFADSELRQAWEAFHRQHASLRIISPRANLSLVRRKGSGITTA